MRVIEQQTNPWASQASNGAGLDPQRTDLWNIDFRSVTDGLTKTLEQTVPRISSVFAQSLTFPELKVKPDVFRRDSNPYNMPGYDEPLDPIKVTFIVESPGSGQSSRIYRVLDSWRRAVRAGRGLMSTGSGLSVQLDNNYRINYAFNVNVWLLRGTKAAVSVLLKQNNGVSVSSGIDLERSGEYTLVNAWLGGFKLGDVSHVDTKFLTIDATLYAEDLVDLNGSKLFQ